MVTHKDKQATIAELRVLMEAKAKKAVVAESVPEDSQKAYQRVLALCGHHEFPSAKMRERLAQEGYDPEAIASAIERAQAVGALDDNRWAEMRVYSLYGRGIGQQGIERDLQAYNLDVHGVDGWPHEFEARYGRELDRALEVLRKSPPRSKNLRDGAFSKLVRKGYRTGIASEAASIWTANMLEGDAVE